MTDTSMYFKYEDILANEFKLWDMLIQATQKNFTKVTCSCSKIYLALVLYMSKTTHIIMVNILSHWDPTFSCWMEVHVIDALLSLLHLTTSGCHFNFMLM